VSLPVTPRRAAQAEYDEALYYLIGISPASGGRFEAAVRQAFADIGANPYQYAVAHADMREALVSGFQYAVYYRVLPARIEVVAVFHTSRDPAVWQARV